MKYISRSPLLIALLLVLVGFGALGGLWLVLPSSTNSVPIATLVPTAAATNPVAPVGTAESDAYHKSVKLAASTRITLVLPAAWQPLDLSAGALSDTLSRLAAADEAAEQHWVIANLLAAIDPDSVALAAVLIDHQTAAAAAIAPSLTVVALPRHDLTLERYLAEVHATLRQAGAIVYESMLDNRVRSDGLPVAFLHYKLEGDGSLAVDGQQMATFNREGTQLILFTFTTPQARYAELLPAFKQIVGTAQYQ